MHKGWMSLKTLAPDRPYAPKLPPHIKVQRAKVIITVDGRKLILRSCADCCVEFYGTENA